MTEEGLLIQKPVKELESLRDRHMNISNRIITQDDTLHVKLCGKNLEIVAEFEVGTASKFGLTVCKSKNEETVIGYNVNKEELYINRKGDISFNDFFPSRDCAQLKAINNKVKLHLFINEVITLPNL